MKQNKPKILFFDIAPYYRLTIDESGIHLYSNSKQKKGGEMSQWKNAFGYLTTSILGKLRTIHGLVAEAVYGPCPKGMEVNHKDGNKLNNRPENLEYVTKAQNIAHSIAHGMHVANDPARSGRYKDGRCADIKAYKLAWYHQNKERLYGRKSNV